MVRDSSPYYGPRLFGGNSVVTEDRDLHISGYLLRFTSKYLDEVDHQVWIFPERPDLFAIKDDISRIFEADAGEGHGTMMQTIPAMLREFGGYRAPIMASIWTDGYGMGDVKVELPVEKVTLVLGNKGRWKDGGEDEE